MTTSLHRNILKNASIGHISQGTIFSGGFSHLYEDCDVWGVIITPRCDIAQDKTSIYFYLPIVRWKDFLIREVYSMLSSQKLEECREKLDNNLKNSKISSSIMKGYLTDDEIDKMFYKNGKKTKELVKLQTQYKEWLFLDQNVEQLKRATSDKEITDIWTRIESICKGNIKSFVDALIKNNNPNYYIIEHPIEKLLVIRLREILRISNDFLHKLKKGIEAPLDLKSSDISIIGNVSEGIYMPIYEIESPYIEHVMQRFMAQFSRIGVEDFNKELIDEII